MTLTALSAAERSRLKRQFVEQAIKLTLERRWAEAAEVNRKILTLTPTDTEAWNRLGKALSELGQYAAARDAYATCLQHDPGNAIAQKNHRRLSILAEQAAQAEMAETKLDPELFIEERGKTALTDLTNVAAAPVLARMAAGDQVYLEIAGSTLQVRNRRGDVLGTVVPRLARRLIEALQSGNRYVAGITNLTDHTVRILIREVYQHPSQAGKPSFPARAGGEVRPYTKDRALREEFEEELLVPDEEEAEEEHEAETLLPVEGEHEHEAELLDEDP